MNKELLKAAREIRKEVLRDFLEFWMASNHISVEEAIKDYLKK